FARDRADVEAAHQRLFGFIEPDRQILIAMVEVEVSSPSAHPGERRDPGETPRSKPATLALDDLGPGVRRDQRELGLIVRPDTQIAVAPGWSASHQPNGLV